jgi:hypothetical protein
MPHSEECFGVSRCDVTPRASRVRHCSTSLSLPNTADQLRSSKDQPGSRHSFVSCIRLLDRLIQSLDGSRHIRWAFVPGLHPEVPHFVRATVTVHSKRSVAWFAIDNVGWSSRHATAAEVEYDLRKERP